MKPPTFEYEHTGRFRYIQAPSLLAGNLLAIPKTPIVALSHDGVFYATGLVFKSKTKNTIFLLICLYSLTCNSDVYTMFRHYIYIGATT